MAPHDTTAHHPRPRSDELRRGPALVGTRIATGDPVPAAGTWQAVDHQGCPGDRRLRALGRTQTAPPCDRCDDPVTWQLAHLAVTVATSETGDPAPT